MFIHRTRIRSLHSPQRSGGKGILLLCRSISRVVIFVHHAAIARPFVLADELPQVVVVILVLNDAAGIGNLRDVSNSDELATTPQSTVMWLPNIYFYISF